MSSPDQRIAREAAKLRGKSTAELQVMAAAPGSMLDGQEYRTIASQAAEIELERRPNASR